MLFMVMTFRIEIRFLNLNLA